MKTLKESILNDIESTMRGVADAVNDEFNIDTIPTPKDFESTRLISARMHRAVWYCPNIIKQCLSKYGKNLISIGNEHIDCIIIVLYAKTNESNEKICKFSLYFGTKDVKYGISAKEKIEGWETIFTNQSIQTCKKKAIEIITKLAKDPYKMYKMIEYHNDVISSGYTLPKKSFNEI